MKFYNLLILVFILLMGIFCFNEVQASEDMNLTRILNIERGREANQIDYKLRHKRNEYKTLSRTGIETFAIDEEGRVYLSNFATGKIKVFYKNSLEMEIDISQFTQPKDIAVTSDSLYIFEDSGKINRLSLDSKEEYFKRAEYSIPTFILPEVEENGSGKSSLEEDIEKVMPVRFVSDYVNEMLSIVYDNNTLIQFKDGKIKPLDLDSYELHCLEGVVYKQILGTDNNGYIYISGIEVSNIGDMIDLRELVYRFDSSGQLTGIAEVIDERNYLVPYKYLAINRKGELYQLLVLEDRVKVYRFSFQSPEGFKREEKKIASSEPDSLSFPGRAAILKLREILYNRAVELIEYSWIYNREEQGTVPADAVLPFYLQKVEKEEELTGIPYCWGGFDSLETRSLNQKWMNFPDAVEKKAITGNIGITDNYLPGTCGLDCSGFVSAILGLESRKPSWYFFYNNDLVKKISYEELSLMDILVKNGHSFFYLNKNDYGINSIETNTLGSEWKVKYFNWSWRALRDTGYRARGYKELTEIPAILNH